MLSKVFLIKQGKCCGNGCLMCPYVDKHSGKGTEIRKDVLELTRKMGERRVKRF